MISRRTALHWFAMLGATLGLPMDTFAQLAKRAPLPRFTTEVRRVTARLRVRPGRWQWIVAHHSAIRHGNAAIYDRAHQQRGMENGLAYHFVIGNGVDSGDGEIEIGPRWLKQLAGGHVSREAINEVGIGICLVGNFEQTRPTAKQILAFRELMDYLRREVVGSKIRFAVHKEIDPGRTACPGRFFPTVQMHRLYGGSARAARA
ncbi:MAG TPA: peptidoglycan recognition family protein [Methylomirabilota bacterium]|nr:peptidoglycan recognition family protein [Methylomirabilota bacterium]